VGRAREAAGLAHEERSGAHGGDDGRLLDDHGHEVVAPVDREVETETHRHREHADDVLGETVRLDGGEDVGAGAERLVVVAAQDAAVAQLLQPLLDAQLVEAGDARTRHATASILAPSRLCGTGVTAAPASANADWSSSVASSLAKTRPRSPPPAPVVLKTAPDAAASARSSRWRSVTIPAPE